jgi:hypothetical protein
MSDPAQVTREGRVAALRAERNWHVIRIAEIDKLTKKLTGGSAPPTSSSSEPCAATPSRTEGTEAVKSEQRLLHAHLSDCALQIWFQLGSYGEAPVCTCEPPVMPDGDDPRAGDLL